MSKNSNLAYAIKAFEQEEKKLTPQIREVQKAKPKASKLSSLKVVFAMLYIFALCSGLLYGKVVLAEKTSLLSEKETELQEVLSESTRLGLKLDNMISLNSLEKQATEQYGLSEVSANQVNYIVVEQDNIIEVENENLSFMDKLSQAYDSFVEYIKG